MQVLPVLLMFFFSSASLGLSVSSKHARQDNDPGNLDSFVFPEWNITNFDTSCSPGGCILTFNISSTATASEPGIDASCTINGDELSWQQCSATPTGLLRDETVWAMPIDSVETVEAYVQHRFVNDSLPPTRHFNVTGEITVDFEVVSMPANFTVMGTSVSETWWWLKVRSTEDDGGRNCVGKDRHVCEPVRNADGSIHGFMHLESEQRSFQRL